MRRAWLGLVAVPAVLLADPPAASRLERLADGRVRLGLVIVDAGARTVTLPAVVNQTNGVVEYALVHETGKTHESLFRTTAGPLDLHAAALLLNVRPAGPSAVTNAVVPPASSVRVEVTWTNAAGRITVPLRDLLELRPDEARRTGAPFSTTNWLYTGSLLTQEGFAAHFEGSIIALIHDPVALANNPAPDAADDDAHFPRAGRLPGPGSPVQVVLHFPGGPRPPPVP